MHRTTGLAALLLTCALATSAHAAGSETQFWTTASVVVPAATDLNASVVVSQRFRDSALGDDILLLRGTLDWRLSPTLAVGVGLTHVESARGHEWRPHQQIVLTFNRISLRSQLEERFVEGAARTQFRLRERAQAVLPLNAANRIVGSGELLYIVRPSSPSDHARIDSWRAYLAMQHEFSKALSASAGYMFIHSKRPRAQDQITHAPQVALLWRL